MKCPQCKQPVQLLTVYRMNGRNKETCVPCIKTYNERQAQRRQERATR